MGAFSPDDFQPERMLFAGFLFHLGSAYGVPAGVGVARTAPERLHPSVSLLFFGRWILSVPGQPTDTISSRPEIGLTPPTPPAARRAQSLREIPRTRARSPAQRVGWRCFRGGTSSQRAVREGACGAASAKWQAAAPRWVGRMASVSSSDMETLERRPSACTAENFQPHAYVEVADDTEQNYEAFKARPSRRLGRRLVFPAKRELHSRVHGIGFGRAGSSA